MLPKLYNAEFVHRQMLVQFIAISEHVSNTAYAQYTTAEGIDSLIEICQKEISVLENSTQIGVLMQHLTILTEIKGMSPDALTEQQRTTLKCIRDELFNAKVFVAAKEASLEQWIL
jgi:hypothetical protein